MKIMWSHFRFRILLAFAALIAAGVALSGAAIPSGPNQPNPALQSAHPIIAAIPLLARERDPKQAALPILLKPNGFEPREITRPAGYYYFSVGNLSRVRDVAFVLEREHGSRINEASARRQKPWRQNVRLTPGVYLLREKDHPDWVCRITVTPH